MLEHTDSAELKEGCLSPSSLSGRLQLVTCQRRAPRGAFGCAGLVLSPRSRLLGERQQVGGEKDV